MPRPCPMPIAALVAALLAIGACSAPAPATPDDRGGLPADDGPRLRMEAAADALHQTLRRRGLILRDPAVNAEVGSVVSRLTAAASADNPPIRPYVLKNPMVNAMALPNGNIYLNSGLIATLENEAQLAAIIAHEINHVWSEDSLQEHARAKDTITAANIADIVLLGLANVGAQATLAGYSREQEEAADLAGLRLFAAAGYEVSEFANAYALMAELPEYAMDKGSIFSSHPEQWRRVAYLRAAVDRDYAGAVGQGTVNSSAYAPLRSQLLELSIQLRLQARLPAMALDTLERGEPLLSNPALGAYYRGEASRAMADHPREAARERSLIAHGRVSDRYEAELSAQVPAHYDEAIASYRQALALDPDLLVAHRGLGLALHARGRDDEARPQLSRYLDQPTPPDDARYIQRLLNDLSGTTP